MNKIMAKLISFVFIIIMLTGCQKSYLSCSKTIKEDEFIKVNQTIKLGYKRRKLVNSNIYFDYKFKNNNQSDIEGMRQTLIEECNSYKDLKGVSCSVKNLNGAIHYELSLEIDKLSEESLTKFEYMLNYGSYMDTKNELSKGYTCN